MLLSEDLWPAHVCVSSWRFKKRNNEDQHLEEVNEVEMETHEPDAVLSGQENDDNMVPVIMVTILLFMKIVIMAATTVKLLNGTSTTQRSLTLMSYNMHGLKQGCSTVRYFRDCVDIFMLQEHWQTPANMSRLSHLFPDYV